MILHSCQHDTIDFMPGMHTHVLGMHALFAVMIITRNAVLVMLRGLLHSTRYSL